MGARAMNLSLGMWLFLSAFLWPHGRPQTINAWAVGIMAVTAALAGLDAHPRARCVNVALGLWLIVSAFLLHPTRPVTAINHVVVGAMMALFGSLRRIGHEPRTQSP
jgi:SPW repeat-containing protein